MARARRNVDMILNIARMRYDQRLSQSEIARALGLSESTISRVLRSAMDLGFVEIQISPYGRRDLDLERQLVQRFGLDVAIVVQPRPGRTESGYEVLGAAVARAVEDRLVPGTILGVADGETIAAVAAGVRRARTGDIDIVSLIGGVGAPQIATHSTEICRVIATNLGARAWHLPVPAVVDDGKAARAFLKMAAVKSVFDLMHRASIALLGIGTISANSPVFRHGTIDRAYLETIQSRGAVGSICARFYDAAGRAVTSDLDERTMAISFADLAKIPLRLAAAQGPGKITAIEAAIRGRLINGLGTDRATASLLLARPD